MVKIKDTLFTINWTVSDNRITLQPSEDGLEVNVVIPELVDDLTIPYTLKFTVTNAKGESLSREYSHFVPEFKIYTFEEYMAAKKDDVIVVFYRIQILPYRIIFNVFFKKCKCGTLTSHC